MDSKSLYLVAAVASLVLSLAHFFGAGFVQSTETAIYIGLWVPTILLLGSLLANKSK